MDIVEKSPLIPISKADAFRLVLPKWPQMLTCGNKVTTEQAKDIIFKTDSFFSNFSKWGSGNNKHWIRWAQKELGYNVIIDMSEYKPDFTEEERLQFQIGNALIEELGKQLGLINAQYVNNTWASSCYIYGPYGWCHPTGTIHFTDNIGKYPTVQEIAEEWEAIGKAFPYLDVWVTLMDGEHCEDLLKPVVTMHLVNSTVEFFQGSTFPHQNMHHMGRADGEMTDFLSSRSSEQGLPNEWIVEYGKITKPLIEKLLISVAGQLMVEMNAKRIGE